METVRHLQETIQSLNERLAIYLLDVISKSKLSHNQRLSLRGEVYRADDDFSALLSFIVRDDWDNLFVPHECSVELRRLSQRALMNGIYVKNDISFELQTFDATTYDHHIELLAKLAAIIGESTLAQSIRNKTNESTNGQEDWTMLKAQGNTLYKQGNYFEAMNLYTQAISLSPSNSMLYSNRASCEINLKKFELARLDAEDAIELDRSNVKHFRILSEALLGLGLLDEARSACAAGLQLQPCDSILIQRERFISVNKTTSDQQSLEQLPRDEDIFDITDMHSYLHIQDLQQQIDQLKQSETLKDFTTMIELTKQQAMLGCAEALCMMGTFFDSNGQLDRTKYFFEQAAAQRPYIRVNGSVMPNKGVAIAENNLGLMYLSGKGVDIDRAKAIEYCRRSVEHGFPAANHNLGFALLNGANDDETLKSARASLAKAADQDIAAAQWAYANMLVDGQGGPVDTVSASIYYRRAAGASDIDADLALACIMLERFKRNTDAFNYLQSAENKGSAAAQHLLGGLYAFGHGCERDVSVAHCCFERAKLQGVDKEQLRTTADIFSFDLNRSSLTTTMGAEVCDFERAQQLSSEKLTITERINRFLFSKLDITPTKVPDTRSQYEINYPWFFKDKNREQIQKRAAFGSVTAERVWARIITLQDVADELKINPSSREAFAKYRAARQDRAPCLFAPNDIETIAETRLVSNPNDGDSLFVLAIGGKKKTGQQRIKFLERCVSLHPDDADFHFLLAVAYQTMALHDQCLSACTRAVQLSSNIDHMILQVDTVILLNKIRRSTGLLSDGTYTKVPTYTTDEIIAMFERILKLIPIDHEQIPETHYKLCEMHLLRGHYNVARHHWREARETAAPDVRLPCFEPVDHDRYLNVNAWMLENNGKILSSHSDSLDGGAAKTSVCGHCGKVKPPKRCICGLVAYCDAKCQKVHWPKHKLIEVHRKKN